MGEAVNFGTADWVPMGRAAVDDYARGMGKRNAVFSHDRQGGHVCVCGEGGGG